jgi:hypothetical protein
MQGRSYRLRFAAMMVGARKETDKPETATETGAGGLGRSTGGPPDGAQSHAAGRYRKTVALRPATALPPSGVPRRRRRARTGEAPESGTENH